MIVVGSSYMMEDTSALVTVMLDNTPPFIDDVTTINERYISYRGGGWWVG